MGRINRKRKMGSSFLEIIIALVIISIISVAIFDNIAFSLKVNKVINHKQTSSLLAQHVLEEIKNMSDDNFHKLAESITNKTENLFLGGEFEDLDKNGNRGNFIIGSEDINTFKVFHKNGTELYVKVLLPKITIELVNEYNAAAKIEAEWEDKEKCKIFLNISPGTDTNNYNVDVIDNEVSTSIPQESFQGSKVGLLFKIRLYTDKTDNKDKLKIYCINNEIDEKEIYSKDVSELNPGDDVNMYIKDTTTKGLNYIFDNISNIKADGTIANPIQGLNLNLYMEKKEGNESEFLVDGSNIRVYGEKINDTGEIIAGENIIIDSVCDFIIEVYKEDKNSKLIKIEGHKKFKRFE